MVARTLPGLGLTGYWDLGADGWKDAMDTNLRVLSVVAGGLVKSRVTALPGSPVAGDIYIVPSGAGSHPNEIAVYDGPAGSLAWVYLVPKKGRLFYVEDEAKNYQFDGSIWVEFGGTASGSGVNIADEGSVEVSPATTINFVGAGVSVSNPTAGVAEVAIPGGGSGGGGDSLDLVSRLNANVGSPKSTKIEYHPITGGVETDLLNISSGSGWVAEIFVAVDAGDFHARDLSKLKVYVDGSATPSVNVTLAYFVAGDWGAQSFMTRFISWESSSSFRGFRITIPMPFSSGVRVTLTPPSGYNISNMWSIVNYYTNGSITWGRMAHFHAVDYVDAAVVAYANVPLLTLASGKRGIFLGTTISAASRNLGFLEGNMSFKFNGSATSDYESSGLEDYFRGSFYFAGGSGAAVHTDESGCTLVNSTTVVAYRFHLDTPMPFDDGFEAAFQMGTSGQGLSGFGTTDLKMCPMWYEDS